MSKKGIFLDSNVLLYLFEDSHKSDRAEALLRQKPLISVQVLNEITQVCRRKIKMEWQEIVQFLDLLRQFCAVVPVTVEIHDLARQLAERYQLAFYDACIAAAAMKNGCHTLYSEDMHSGLVLKNRLTILTPF